jgi:hypothetical protein
VCRLYFLSNAQAAPEEVHVHITDLAASASFQKVGDCRCTCQVGAHVHPPRRPRPACRRRPGRSNVDASRDRKIDRLVLAQRLEMTGHLHTVASAAALLSADHPMLTRWHDVAEHRKS